MSKKTKRGVPVPVVILLSLLGICAGIGNAGYRYYRNKYTQNDDITRKLMIQDLEEGSLEYKIASHFISDEEWEKLTRSDAVVFSSADTPQVDIPAEELLDLNGDGVEIQHVYGDTYEGYMMVVKDPSMVRIAINPDMGSGRAAPELEDYVERFNAIGGINGGGFEDSGGTGNGSIPAGITIMDGRLVSGGNAQMIVGLTKDHKLICDTMTGQQALDRGIVQAVTFGPTFITNGRVTYVPGTDNLNMVNPRTAIGQQKDGTMLLLVIDGRGPSSFGAKYEDVIKIFQDYDAVMAGNLDGGNSSVMIYDGRYVHYPVSMYDSRNLPSVFLITEGD